ncbi:hypothetical protein P692DRAFT_20924000 [Suillus brevipes Sb2]|nr:hypothetical protein P692DRAFT_20924000 [Suillus brevipes Sb2]
MMEADLWRDKFVMFEQYAERLSAKAGQLRSKIGKEQRETKHLSGLVHLTAAEKAKLQTQLRDMEVAHKEALVELERMHETVALGLGHCEGDVAYDLCGCYWCLVLRRAAHPSLGLIVLSALILTGHLQLGVSIPENTRETPVMIVSELCSNGDLFDNICNVPTPSLKKVPRRQYQITAKGTTRTEGRSPFIYFIVAFTIRELPNYQTSVIKTDQVFVSPEGNVRLIIR